MHHLVPQQAAVDTCTTAVHALLYIHTLPYLVSLARKERYLAGELEATCVHSRMTSCFPGERGQRLLSRYPTLRGELAAPGAGDGAGTRIVPAHRRRCPPETAKYCDRKWVIYVQRTAHQPGLQRRVTSPLRRERHQDTKTAAVRHVLKKN